MDKLILCIKTVSKTTKLSVHFNRKQIYLINIKHPLDELCKFNSVIDQFELRKHAVLEELKRANIELSDIGIVVGRGGLLKPIPGGVYHINEAMLKDIYHPIAEHESNLGGLIADAIAKEIGNNVNAVIVDPACVDEMDPIAKISGMPDITRRSFLHTLSQRAVAMRFAVANGKAYETVNVIVAHLGSGISVGAHCKGKIIDVNNGLNGDGPMSPTRSGGVPVGQLVDLCFSGKFTQEEIMTKICGNGGMKAYLGTNDAIEIEKRITSGDKEAEIIYNAIAYQISKEIGALSTVLKGEVDGILITGGLAYSQYIVNEITERVKHIGEIRVYPGENEMQALAMNGYMVLNGEIEVKEYV